MRKCGIRNYAPASLLALDRWFKSHGAATPPPAVCSPVRWRIYLAYRANRSRYDNAFGADGHETRMTTGKGAWK